MKPGHEIPGANGHADRPCASMTFPDAELSAYIDGQLPAEQSQRLKRCMAKDGILRDRVRDLQRVRLLIRLAYTAGPQRNVR